ncbi:MAG: RodZ domain-containing protein [Thermoleophilia bacterium]
MFEIGNTLREARVRRNLTLQQVEEDTKIRVKYVQAMENEDFDIMPGAAYVKGFLRTYCTYLGLDPEVIIGEYRSRGALRGENVEPFAGSSIIGKPRSHRGRNTAVFVAVVCLLVLAVIYVLGVRAGDEGTATTKPGALGLTSGSPSPSSPASPSLSVKERLVDVVRIKAVAGDCWVQVRRDGPEGTQLFTGTLREGERKGFKGRVLWIRLDQPSAVRLVVEGTAVAPFGGAGPVDLLIENGDVKEQG